MIWIVYLLKCCDDTIYTGVTNNLERRLHEHNHTKKGAKYTKTRRPVSLFKFFEVESKSYALRIEIKIKSLKRDEKIKFSLDDYDYKQEKSNQ